MAVGCRDPANAFNEGLILFNQGRFFACHEAWEAAWKQSQGVERALLQGLIQAAVAMLRFERGNLRGARLVYAKACAKLDPLPTELLGLELEEFKAALHRFFAEIASGRAKPAPPLLRMKNPARV